VVDDWSSLLTGDTAEQLRNTFVVLLLTEAVTGDLPPGWQGRLLALRSSRTVRFLSASAAVSGFGTCDERRAPR